MTRPYTLFSWKTSLYGGKVKSYLMHKSVPFDYKSANFFRLFVQIPRHTGARAIPVLVTPQGQWIQDSSEIIDCIEARFPEPAVVPRTPRLAFAAYLIELWGDEFWLPVAMHTRWSNAENLDWFKQAAGDHLLPGFPRFIRDALAGYAANQMRDFKPRLGITATGIPLIERWAQTQLDALDAHFAQHPFLFGGRPCLADYGLFGPLFAHLTLDPWSKRNLIEPRPHVHAWIERMQVPLQASGELFADDRLPETLMPLLHSLFDEMLPYFRATLAELQRAALNPEHKGRIPRYLDNVAYPYAGGTHQRNAFPYGLWMVQRMLDRLHQQPEADQATVREWLAEHGGEGWLELDLPRLRRDGLSVALDNK